MTDMLCSLIHLPAIEPILEKVKGHGVTIRRPNPWEQTALRKFIEEHFSVGWADEVSVAFHAKPVTCFVAIHEKKIVGFAGYECTRRNYFGPTGVAPSFEKMGIGTALLQAALRGLQSLGYSYAVIGSVSSIEYYQKAAGAVVIPFADGKGIYGLKEEPAFLQVP